MSRQTSARPPTAGAIRASRAAGGGGRLPWGPVRAIFSHLTCSVLAASFGCMPTSTPNNDVVALIERVEAGALPAP